MEEAGVKLIAQGAAAFNTDLKGASSAVDGFGKEADKAATLVQDAAGRWRTASGRFASDAEKAAAGVETVAPAAKKAGDAAEQAGNDAEKGGRGFDAFGEIVTGALRKVGEIAVSALADAARATAAFVGDSINLAGDFEAGMLNFQAVAGKDVDTKGLEQFRDLFLQIGKELPVSTADVQNAAIEMIKGGIDPAIVAAGGLRQNIQFAAAAMDGDLVSAAEISGKILGGWAASSATAEEKADFLTKATNLLTKAANASAVDVKGLSLGIFNAQGIAKTAGVSFDDLTTTLAALAPRFASSSEAGNSLKNMIARLQPTTDPATEAMAGLGLYTDEAGSAFYDAQGNFVGFEKAAQMLQDSLKDLTKEQQAATLQQIFGNDAMGSAAALADMGAEGYRAMAAAMTEANGVSENAALKQQGFNTALDNAKGSVEALQITIGSALLPVLADLMNNVISPAVNTLTDMADAIFGNDEAFARLSPTAQGIVSVIDLVVADVQEIIGAFNDGGASSGEFAQRLDDLASDLGAPVGLIGSIVTAVQDLVAWFNTAGDESSALGGAVDDLSGIWTLASKVVDDVMQAYQRIAQAVLPVVTQFVEAHGDDISAFFKTTWDQVINIVTLALKLYDSIVPPILNAVAGFIETHGEEIQKVLTGAWNIITSLITGTLQTIEGIIKVALDLINGDWDAAWTDIQGVIQAQVTAIEGIVGGFLDMIAGIFNTSMGDILKTWKNNWDQALDIVSKIDWKEVGTNIIAGIIAGVEGAAGSLMRTLTNLANDALSAAKDALGISSPSTEFAAVGQYAIQGIMVGMDDMLPALIDLVNATGTTMITALTKNISKGGDAIRDQMADLKSDIEKISEDINNAIGDAFGATASIDRQMAKNFDRLNDIESDTMAKYIQQSLAAEQKTAESFLDPAEGAKYFKMVSDNIFETAELQQKMNAATDEDERARLQAQWVLISRAQDAEMAQFRAAQQGQTAPQQDIAAQIAALFQSNDVARNLPGVLQSQIIAQLTSLMQQLQTAQGTTSPPMMAAQYSGWQAPPASSSTRTYNMPIYTNQTPAALQQSLAIAQAVMP